MTIANVAWRRSGRDKQVHAFVLSQIAEANRTFLEALCRHSAPARGSGTCGARPR